MATVSPAFTTPSNTANVVTWAGMVTGDTINSWQPHAMTGVAGSIQISGTFNGGTIAVLQVSNDGSTWFTAKNLQGDDISATANAFFELSTAAQYMRMNVASGSADSITATLVLRR